MPSVQGYCEAYINDKCRRHKSLSTYSDVKEMYVCIFFKITHSLSPNLWVMRNLTSDLLRAFLPTSTNRVPESYAIQGCSWGEGEGISSLRAACHPCPHGLSVTVLSFSGQGDL